jgi:SAM-dependent methyltransferase
VNEHNTEYDPFAAIYNRYWGAEYHSQVFPVLDRLFFSRLPKGASILDVCCGTGKLTALVKSRGFSVSGIDASAAMLAYARQNAPGVEFTLADVRSFSIPGKFDGAYSIFESLNHLPDGESLHSAFLRVREHLTPGAPFLFDLNREDAFLAQWNQTDALVDSETVWVTRSHYDQAKRLGVCEVTVFNSSVEQGWNRSDFTLRQTCHDINAAHDALSRAGFGSIALYDAADMGMDEYTGYARTFFLATAA